MRKAVHLFGKAVRETGQALDRFGLRVGENEIYKETYARHRTVMNLFDKRPSVANGVFVAPNAAVIGDVSLLDYSSVWYGAVLRADKARITIGTRTNIQDRAVISTVTSLDSGYLPDVDIGNRTTVGHGALLTSCVVGEDCLIGQGAIISAGCDIGNKVIVAAGAVVLPDTVIPDGQLWAGNPANYVRDVTDEEVASIDKSAETYRKLAMEHDGENLPVGTVYQDAEKVKAV